MKTYTVTEYEQEDFDKVKESMTAEKAIEILEGLPRGYFPYNLPEWGKNVDNWDYDNYEICCAIDKAIEALREKEKNKPLEKSGEM